MPSGSHQQSELPQPDEAARRHSEAVEHRLIECIGERGPITLAEYLQTVLYEPGLGYYAVGNQKLGAGGDFVTAPELSDHFGTALAGQVAQVLHSTGGDILEFGAGTGALARVLLGAQALADFEGQYYILEPSAELQIRQQELLDTALPTEVFARCSWLSALPESFTGVMLANEVIDAMPVERFLIEKECVQQLYVSHSTAGFELLFGDPDEAVTAAVNHLQYDLRREFSEGYQSEINLLLPAWVKSVSDCLRLGLLLCIDYGYPRREYYLPERSDGTLRCYYRHRVHDNLFLYPGLQDITSDVDFTLLAEAGQAAGLDLHGFTNQGQFLLGNKLVTHADLSSVTDTRERLLAAQSVRTLTTASGMGERFKVMALSRDLELDLDGFSALDQSHRL
ncbi:MAG: SAM-dependent methyltransferase [Gammaproteobacteria bacterium]|nr:SAM-dependent methyltransferase [Gammaproteobacteria bacterium]